MPNSIGPTGLTTATQAELLAQFTSDFQTIYGADINLASNTPDGQLMNNFIQQVLDLEDLLTQIYNSFDPDNAIGVILDQRVSINGIQRQAGTFTITNITIVTNQSVTLYGLDQTVQPVYTVSDNAGNQWQLVTSQSGVSPGTNVYAFQSAVAGAVLTVPNTINVQVTIVLGVVSVNNPTTYTTLGINEESDANLKVRRQKSVSLASQGYYKGLLAALENINGVTGAFIYENDTNATDVDGVPSHSIWVIIGGSPAAVDIATAIYEKRNAGCGMFGSTSYNIVQVNGTIFTVYWDMVMAQNLFIKFTASSINGTTQPNIAAIRSGLVTSFVPGVYQEVNINSMATQVQVIDPNTLVTQAGFSTGQTQVMNFSGVSASGAFVLNYNGNLSASINWNDSVSTIQSKMRAVTGLSTITVTGSIASESLTFNLTTIQNVQALIFPSSNTLATSSSAPVLLTFNEGYTQTLTPVQKDYQFVTQSANVIILPMILTPTSSSVTHGTGTVSFAGLGGYGTYTYTLQTNNSGATLNSSSGVYTAGTTHPVVDTVLVTDSFGNQATATVSVT